MVNHPTVRKRATAPLRTNDLPGLAHRFPQLLAPTRVSKFIKSLDVVRYERRFVELVRPCGPGPNDLGGGSFASSSTGCTIRRTASWDESWITLSSSGLSRSGSSESWATALRRRVFACNLRRMEKPAIRATRLSPPS